MHSLGRIAPVISAWLRRLQPPERLATEERRGANSQSLHGHLYNGDPLSSLTRKFSRQQQQGPAVGGAAQATRRARITASTPEPARARLRSSAMASCHWRGSSAPGRSLAWSPGYTAAGRAHQPRIAIKERSRPRHIAASHDLEALERRRVVCFRSRMPRIEHPVFPFEFRLKSQVKPSKRRSGGGAKALPECESRGLRRGRGFETDR
jgi:hypothetical protein